MTATAPDIRHIDPDACDIHRQLPTEPPRTYVEQDWCTECSLDPDDGPGMPVDVVDVSTEVEVQTIHGTGPEYLVVHLACGHTITQLQTRCA